jgi:hypothetical protein
MLSIFAALAGLAGCGGAGASVKGHVNYDGKPVQGHKDGVVIFYPDSGKGNTSKFEARGKLESDGTYDLTSDNAASKSIPLGWYKVAVRANVPSNPKDEYSLPKSVIPDKYKDPKTSGITIEVVAGAAPGTYDLKLEKK